jgi:hypothetical protein
MAVAIPTDVKNVDRRSTRWGPKLPFTTAELLPIGLCLSQRDPRRLIIVRTGADRPNADEPRRRLVVRRHRYRQVPAAADGDNQFLLRGSCAVHSVRKGYYLAVPADYVCVVCGRWFNETEVRSAPPPPTHHHPDRRG